LDEIEGEARANMAREVAKSADLILFIVAGDITRTEYESLAELRRAKKPLILVFNKIDLYPEADRRRFFSSYRD
jgi:predicted GTPase